MKSLLPLLLVSGLAIADDAAVLRCRALTDPAARLACYDAMVVLPATSVPKAEAVTAKTVSPAIAGSSASPSTQKPDQFGLEAKMANRNEIDAIESQIDGSFDGWRPRSNISLANGQVWQISDDSSRTLFLNNPKVKIRRGVLGAFYLEIQGTNHSPRVKRVQ